VASLASYHRLNISILHVVFQHAFLRLTLNPPLLKKERTFPEGANPKGRQIGLLAGGKPFSLALEEEGLLAAF
jgi:hypothetical protein